MLQSTIASLLLASSLLYVSGGRVLTKHHERPPKASPKGILAESSQTTSLLLIWDKVPTSKHRSVTRYEVLVEKADYRRRFMTEGDETNVRVTDLDENTYYQVKIRAINLAGAGPWSEKVVLHTPTSIEDSDGSGLNKMKEKMREENLLIFNIFRWVFVGIFILIIVPVTVHNLILPKWYSKRRSSKNSESTDPDTEKNSL